jgi:hypothetical protein
MMPQATDNMSKFEEPKKRGNVGNLTRMGMGRPKGAVPKQKKVLTDCLMMAGDIAGDKITPGTGLVGYLVHLAMNKPDLYVSMLQKVIPLQVTGTASDGALEIRWLPPQEPPKVIEHEEVDDGR